MKLPEKKNIFEPVHFSDHKEEIFEEVLRGNEFFVERIISNKKVKRKEQWYDQEKNEWVLLLKGSALLEFADGQKLQMNTGDFIRIGAHVRHKVVSTCDEEDTFWLAIHEI